MNIKPIVLILVLIIAATALAGCRMPAATQPVGTATSAVNFPVPGGNENGSMGVFGDILTQTAAAQSAGAVPPVQNTPVPGETQVVVNPPVGEQPTNPPSGDTSGGTAPEATQPAPVQPTTPEQQPAPGPAQNVVVPTATPGLPSSYTLLKGEYVFCLARRFDLNPFDILSLNGLGQNSVIQPGTSLRMPSSGDFPGERTLHSHPTTYSVRAGDTLGSIACYFGDADPNAIMYANGLSSPDDVDAGTTLVIP